MNGKTARRIHAIACKLSPEGSGIIRHQGTRVFKHRPLNGEPAIDIPMPWETVERTGTRRTYRRLKRQIMDTPRKLRNEVLEALESYQ